MRIRTAPDTSSSATSGRRRAAGPAPLDPDGAEDHVLHHFAQRVTARHQLVLVEQLEDSLVLGHHPAASWQGLDDVVLLYEQRPFAATTSRARGTLAASASRTRSGSGHRRERQVASRVLLVADLVHLLVQADDLVAMSHTNAAGRRASSSTPLEPQRPGGPHSRIVHYRRGVHARLQRRPPRSATTDVAAGDGRRQRGQPAKAALLPRRLDKLRGSGSGSGSGIGGQPRPATRDPIPGWTPFVTPFCRTQRVGKFPLNSRSR